MTTAVIMWNVFFGAIGLGFFMYGKSQAAAVPLICGIGLMVFPYFVTNVYLMVLAGVGLCALPFIYKP